MTKFILVKNSIVWGVGFWPEKTHYASQMATRPVKKYGKRFVMGITIESTVKSAKVTWSNMAS